MKVLVTGATNGMGLGTARALVQQPNVHVLVHGRSEARCKATVAALGGPERASALVADLSRLSDVAALVETIRRDHADLDAIFVNAGLGYLPEQLITEDGHDGHFQVNYLAHFQLVLGVLDLLENSEHGGRVVFNATHWGEVQFDDLKLERKWGHEPAIFQGMAAKRLFYARLHALYTGRSAKVSCYGFVIHKTVWSNQLTIIPWWMRAVATLFKGFGQFISIDQCGAVIAPLLVEDRATSSSRSGQLLTWKKGAYPPYPKGTPADPADIERLWNLSLDLCDERTRESARRLEA